MTALLHLGTVDSTSAICLGDILSREITNRKCQNVALNRPLDVIMSTCGTLEAWQPFCNNHEEISLRTNTNTLKSRKLGGEKYRNPPSLIMLFAAKLTSLVTTLSLAYDVR